MPRSAIDPIIRDRAKRLRADMTGHEVLLWTGLRDFRAHGAKFRRQAPIGPYVADFAWLAGRLVVEVDGGQHTVETKDYDERRDTWLRSQGFEVVRIWNDEVVDNLDGVLETIFRMIVERGANPTPAAVPAADPPHEGEGRARTGRLPRRKPKG